MKVITDTLEEDWPYFDESDHVGTYHPLYVDAVVSNPPYSQTWEPKDKENEPRYKDYGLAPKAKADYAFLLHDLYHIKPDGIMTIVLPHGVLFRGGAEEQIRKNLIERNNIDTIIGLPANIFFGTGIPTIIMVLKQKRTNTDVLVIDASKGFIKVGKNNKLQESDIRRIVDTVKNRVSIPKFSRVVSKDEIRQNEYNLNIPRYVDSSEKPESYDIYATMFGGIPNKEISDLNDYWNTFPSLKTELFKEINDGYSTCELETIEQTIKNNSDVINFINNFNNSFNDFPSYLRKELIDNVLTLNVAKEENNITLNIFDRLNDVKLIDKYKAYQLFSDNWQTISQDIEVIQTEGKKKVTEVIPNMVIKKKDGKESEVQEGYKGLILPFELVQNELLKDKLDDINQLNNKLSSVTLSLEEMLESFEEDEKGQFINEEGTAFVGSEVSKLVKSYKKQTIEEDSFESKIIKVNDLINKEKEIKKSLKDKNAKLHTLTKETLENMSLDEGLDILDVKWNRSIVESIENLPSLLIKDLVSKINALKNKYKDTLIDIDNEISSTSNELNSLIDELVGDEFDMKGLQELKKLLGGE